MYDDLDPRGFVVRRGHVLEIVPITREILTQLSLIVILYSIHTASVGTVALIYLVYDAMRLIIIHQQCDITSNTCRVHNLYGLDYSKCCPY